MMTTVASTLASTTGSAGDGGPGQSGANGAAIDGAPFAAALLLGVTALLLLRGALNLAAARRYARMADVLERARRVPGDG